MKSLIAVTLIGITLSFFQVINAKVINLPKQFEKEQPIVGKLFSNKSIGLLRKNTNNKYIYTLKTSSESVAITLPWKPTHLESNAKNNVMVFASLKLNGHSNSKSKLDVFKGNFKSMSLDNVEYFKITGNGERLFVIRNSEGVVTNELFDLEGNLITTKNWGKINNTRSMAFSLSNDGMLFLPRPQSPDIETWTSIKSFSGSNYETELKYEFEGERVYDGLAINENKIVLIVERMLMAFDGTNFMWSFSPKYLNIRLTSLAPSDDGEYIIATDTDSNSFYVLDTFGKVVLEHSDSLNHANAERLNFLPSRKKIRGASYSRSYNIRNGYLIIQDETLKKLFVIDLTTQKHKVLPANKSLLDVAPELNKIINRSGNLVKKDSIFID